MSVRKLTKKDIGKYITFKHVTRWGTPKTKRKITHVFKPNGRQCCGVTYNGCRPFYVHHGEILEISES